MRKKKLEKEKKYTLSDLDDRTRTLVSSYCKGWIDVDKCKDTDFRGLAEERAWGRTDMLVRHLIAYGLGKENS